MHVTKNFTLRKRKIAAQVKTLTLRPAPSVSPVQAGNFAGRDIPYLTDMECPQATGKCCFLEKEKGKHR
jgi:hypothetical protein